MKIGYKYSATILMSLALANWSFYFQSRCQGAEQTAVNLPERTRVSEGDGPGLLPIDQAPRFASSIMAQATGAGLIVMSTSKVTSTTNASFTELRQNLNLQATEPQLLDFLGKVAASNSTLRVQSLALHPSPDRGRLQASVTITGNYRVPAAGRSQESAPPQIEYRVLSQRRLLRQAAVGCYNLTKSSLPQGWSLDSFSFQDGKRLSVQGVAPADQVRVLEDVRAGIEKGRTQEGTALFRPSSGEATMQMITPALTNFSWEMQFDLRPPEAH
jgi:hypothetical protein